MAQKVRLPFARCPCLCEDVLFALVYVCVSVCVCNMNVCACVCSSKSSYSHQDDTRDASRNFVFTERKKSHKHS